MHIESRGAGTPIILIHGFGVDHRILLPLDPVLEAAGGWRRVYLDLPGMGQTPIGSIAGAQAMADAVAEAVREVVGDEPFAVLGNSFGAVMARSVAQRFEQQVLGLATIAGVFQSSHALRDVPPRTVLHADPSLYDGVDARTAQGYRDFSVVESAAGLRNFVETVQPGVDAADPAAIESISRNYTLDIEPEDAASAPFDKPALFIAGRQDDVVGYADAWRRLEHYPRASLLVLDAAGHNLLGEQPRLVDAAVAEWLGRVRAASASAAA